jgi:RimJ/RimL family protein N-acetyltransferase
MSIWCGTQSLGTTAGGWYTAGMANVLKPLELADIDELVAVAVADAAPEEVIPPVPGPPGWTAERRAACRAFFLEWAAERPIPGARFAVVDEGRLVGIARLSPVDPPGTREIGMWLARSARGRGVGVAAVTELLAQATAQGVAAVVAETTRGNAAALGVLRRCGARLAEDPATGQVHADLTPR